MHSAVGCVPLLYLPNILDPFRRHLKLVACQKLLCPEVWDCLDLPAMQRIRVSGQPIPKINEIL